MPDRARAIVKDSDDKTCLKNASDTTKWADRARALPAWCRSRALDLPRGSHAGVAALAFALVLCIQGYSLFVGHQGSPQQMLRVPNSSGSTPSAGFDGQFFLALANDPWLLHGSQGSLDAPQLRARRIGLPLIAWALAPFGGTASVRLLMAEVLFLIVLLFVAQDAARTADLPSLLALAIAALLPFVISIELVTSELPTAAMLLFAAHEQRKGRRCLAAVLFGFACICREVAVLAVAAFAADSLIHGKRKDAAILLGGCLPFVAWCSYLWFRFPDQGRGSGLLQNLCAPGEGLVKAVYYSAASVFASGLQLKPLGLLAATLWYAVGTVLAVLLLRKGVSAGRLTACAGALIVLLLSYGGAAMAYNGIFNFGRQLFLLVAGLLIVLLEESDSLSHTEQVLLISWVSIGGVLGVSWWLREIVQSLGAAA